MAIGVLALVGVTPQRLAALAAAGRAEGGAPSAAAGERKQVLDELAKTPAAEKRLAWEDVYWSVLSSKEFLFNH